VVLWPARACGYCRRVPVANPSSNLLRVVAHREVVPHTLGDHPLDSRREQQDASGRNVAGRSVQRRGCRSRRARWCRAPRGMRTGHTGRCVRRRARQRCRSGATRMGLLRLRSSRTRIGEAGTAERGPSRKETGRRPDEDRTFPAAFGPYGCQWRCCVLAAHRMPKSLPQPVRSARVHHAVCQDLHRPQAGGTWRATIISDADGIQASCGNRQQT